MNIAGQIQAPKFLKESTNPAKTQIQKDPNEQDWSKIGNQKNNTNQRKKDNSSGQE